MSSIQTPLSQKRVQFSTNNRLMNSACRTPTPASSSTDRLTQPSPLAKFPRLTTPTTNNKSNSIASTSSSTTNNSDSNSITVGIRVRPLCPKERNAGFHECTFLDPESNNTQIWLTDKSNKTHKFGGDFIITDQTSPNLPVTGKDGIIDPNIIGTSFNRVINPLIYEFIFF